MMIGVDLGGTKIEAVLMNESGLVLRRERIQTPRNDYKALLAACSDLIRPFKAMDPEATIGIGTPGTLSLKTGRMKNCNNTCLNGKALKEDLIDVLGCEVRIANDADCFTLSEAMDGAGRGSESVFGVILGTGVGGGFCINNAILRGPNSIAGEWGHVTLPVHSYNAFVGQTIPDPESGERKCYCGAVDCVETWLSGPGLSRSWFELTGEEISAKELAERSRGGNELAGEVLEQYHVLLAMGLSIVINVFDPWVIVLGGGLSRISEIYRKVPDLLGGFVFSDDVRTRLVPADHGDSSGVRGAAWLWSEKRWSLGTGPI
ncbi:MAG: ROK family protein [Gammaproteobacteria bacterium]|nr:ROK family protein [Gammaproteobacteria bacterium]